MPYLVLERGRDGEDLPFSRLWGRCKVLIEINATDGDIGSSQGSVAAATVEGGNPSPEEEVVG